jgi:hypothetical protein
MKMAATPPPAAHAAPAKPQAAPERKATGGRSMLSVNCPICGKPAKADLAPNPGMPQGGESPPHEPEAGPPPAGGVTHYGGMGQWLLVICEDHHRTLWSEARLDEIKGEVKPGELFR